MQSLNISPEELIRYCYQCGKCTGICPLGDISFFSPRILIHNAVFGNLTDSRRLSQCSTCDLCSSRCPMNIKLSEFVREERYKLRQQGILLDEAHFGIFNTLGRIMANSKISPGLNEYFSKDMKFSENSEILLFTGCLSLFDTIFDYDYTRIGKNAMKILNLLNISPQILKDQKCCGHDLFWGGDYENFKKLGQYNLEKIENSGVELVITICPECYRTFQLDYPRYVKKYSFKVLSFAEFLEQQIAEGHLTFSYAFPYKLTYQDPCRLGRQLGVYNAPRAVLKEVPGVQLEEMEHNRENAICCGVSAWMNCNLYSKAIRMERLMEAQKTADILITNCPHCLIHFNCLKNEYRETENKYSIEIMDFTNFIAKALLLE
ncbi:MAG TPA: (Fe-S)-binding protein [Candidatus Deferrimicrobium sp.]|nr:(Fe-S)-binding protein [Candidatus Deferrimicrobium sp.]